MIHFCDFNKAVDGDPPAAVIAAHPQLDKAVLMACECGKRALVLEQRQDDGPTVTHQHIL